MNEGNRSRRWRLGALVAPLVVILGCVLALLAAHEKGGRNNDTIELLSLNVLMASGLQSLLLPLSLRWLNARTASTALARQADGLPSNRASPLGWGEWLGLALAPVVFLLPAGFTLFVLLVPDALGGFRPRAAWAGGGEIAGVGRLAWVLWSVYVTPLAVLQSLVITPLVCLRILLKTDRGRHAWVLGSLGVSVLTLCLSCLIVVFT